MNFDVEKQWVTDAGYKAVCILIHDMHRCGYVGIPKDHPLYGKDYGDNCECLIEPMKKLMNSDEPIDKRGVIPLVCAAGSDKVCMDIFFDVHGSITYCGGLDDYPIKNPDKLWFVGFDCGHSGDGSLSSHAFFGGDIRSMEYVVQECESLARQLFDVSTL